MTISFGQNCIIIWAELHYHLGRIALSFGQNEDLISAELYYHFDRISLISMRFLLTAHSHVFNLRRIFHAEIQNGVGGLGTTDLDIAYMLNI